MINQKLANIVDVRKLFNDFFLKFNNEKEYKKEYAQLYLFIVLKDLFEKGIHRSKSGISPELLANELRKNNLTFENDYGHKLHWPEKTKNNEDTIKPADQAKVRRYINGLKYSLNEIQNYKKDPYKITIKSIPLLYLLPNASKKLNTYIFTYGINQLSDYDQLIEKCKEYNYKFLFNFRAIYNPDKYPYIHINKIENEIREFINSPENNLFVITGNAGVGKTSLLFNFADECNTPCFLFSGKFHHARKITSLKEEIDNPLQSLIESKDSLSIIQKTVKKENKYFILIIDALDEFYDAASVLEEISLLIRDFRNKYPNIKLLISCCKDIWDNLININKIFLPSFSIGYLDNFTDVELDEAMKLYSNKFSVELPKLTPNQKDLLRNPFFFRITFETIEGKEFKDISFLKIFNNYWNVKIGYNSERELFVLKLADYINKVNESRISQSANPFNLISLDWFNQKIFESLLNDGILIQERWRFGKLVHFFHSNFYEFALAKSFIEDMQNDTFKIDNLLSNLGEFSNHLSEAIGWFLLMLDSNLRLLYCRKILNECPSNNIYAENIIVNTLKKIIKYNDSDMDIIYEIVSRSPMTAMFFIPSGLENPEEYLKTLYKAIYKISSNDSKLKISEALTFIPSVMQSIGNPSKTFINTLLKRFKEGYPLQQAVTVPPLLYCLSLKTIYRNGQKENTLKNTKKTNNLIKYCINNNNYLIHKSIAINFNFIVEINVEPSFWSPLAKILASSSYDDIREDIYSSLAHLVIEIPEILKEISKWKKDNNSKIRMAAISILLEVDRKKCKYGLNYVQIPLHPPLINK